MKPLFTIHAGEFLVGDHIGRTLKQHFDVWLPVRDTGVDLLLTPRNTKSKRSKPIKLQVKFSRSFSAKFEHDDFVARGWFKLNTAKFVKSEADVWVFVILTMRHEPYYLLVPIDELKRRMPRPRPATWHMYFTLFRSSKSAKLCLETRTLKKHDVVSMLDSGEPDPRLDYTKFLDNWSVLAKTHR